MEGYLRDRSLEPYHQDEIYERKRYGFLVPFWKDWGEVQLCHLEQSSQNRKVFYREPKMELSDRQ